MKPSTSHPQSDSELSSSLLPKYSLEREFKNKKLIFICSALLAVVLLCALTYGFSLGALALIKLVSSHTIGFSAALGIGSGLTLITSALAIAGGIHYLEKRIKNTALNTINEVAINLTTIAKEIGLREITNNAPEVMSVAVEIGKFASQNGLIEDAKVQAIINGIAKITTLANHIKNTLNTDDTETNKISDISAKINNLLNLTKQVISGDGRLQFNQITSAVSVMGNLIKQQISDNVINLLDQTSTEIAPKNINNQETSQNSIASDMQDELPLEESESKLMIAADIAQGDNGKNITLQVSTASGRLQLGAQKTKDSTKLTLQLNRNNSNSISKNTN